MNNFVVWAFFGCLVVFALIAGIVYAFGHRFNSNTIDNLSDEQEYVRRNIDKFRVKNKGSSLDEDNLYLIDYNHIGL